MTYKLHTICLLFALLLLYAKAYTQRSYPSEVYHPQTMHTAMTDSFPIGLSLPFLGDRISNVQRVNDSVIYTAGDIITYSGDIVLGSYADVISPTSIYQNISPPYSDFLWDCNLIPYVIDGAFSDSEIVTIHEAIRYVNRMTHVYWKPQQNETCFVLFEKKIASYSSPIGCYCKVINKPHIIELDINPCFGCIVHEMTHTMGLYHEHQRNDRPVTIFGGNIMPAYHVNFAEQKNLPTYLQSLPAIYSNYDYESIMHYNQYGFSILPPLVDYPSMSPLATINALGNPIGQRTHYSLRDTAKIHQLYPNGIEKALGQNQYIMKYAGPNVAIQYDLVAAYGDTVLTAGTTNTPFILIPDCNKQILKVKVGGCTYYEDVDLVF